MNTSQNLPIHPTRRHPLTGQPLQAIGHRKDGRLIWPIMGGDETAGQGGAADGGQNGGQAAGDGGQGAQQGTGGTGGQAQGQQVVNGGQNTPPTLRDQVAQQVQDGQQQTAEKVEDLPDWAQKLIRDTRQEAGDNRTAKNAAETERQKLLDGIATALGLKKDGEGDKPDPDKLTEQLTQTQQQARQAAVELAVFKTAGKHQGDADALLDSRSFLTKVNDLDPAADDFATKIDSAIADAVKENPKLKAGRAPGASSVDHAGGSGEQRRTSNGPVSLDSAVSAHYGTS